MDLSQSNVEGNQLKHCSESPKTAPTEDLVLSGQTLETVQRCHGPDVVYAALDNNGLKALPIISSRSRASASLIAIGADPLLVPSLRLAQYNSLD
jgi:hypothetical protein